MYIYVSSFLNSVHNTKIFRHCNSIIEMLDKHDYMYVNKKMKCSKLWNKINKQQKQIILHATVSYINKSSDEKT